MFSLLRTYLNAGLGPHGQNEAEIDRLPRSLIRRANLWSLAIVIWALAWTGGLWLAVTHYPVTVGESADAYLRSFLSNPVYLVPMVPGGTALVAVGLWFLRRKLIIRHRLYVLGSLGAGAAGSAILSWLAGGDAQFYLFTAILIPAPLSLTDYYRRGYGRLLSASLAGLFAFLYYLALSQGPIVTLPAPFLEIASTIAQAAAVAGLFAAVFILWRRFMKTDEQAGAVDKDLQATGQRISEELQFASTVQKGLLPGPVRIWDRFTIYGSVVPQDTVSGDYYDVVERGDYFYVSVFDTSTKGLAAAVLSLAVRRIFWEETNVGSDPAEIFRRAGARLGDVLPDEADPAVILLRVSRSGHMDYLNSGSTRPVLFSAQEQKFFELPAANGPEPRLMAVPLQEGDRLFLFSRGVAQQRNSSGKSYGAERLVSTIKEAVQFPAAVSQDRLMENFSKFQGGARPDDDRLLVTVECS